MKEKHVTCWTSMAIGQWNQMRIQRTKRRENIRDKMSGFYLEKETFKVYNNKKSGTQTQTTKMIQNDISRANVGIRISKSDKYQQNWIWNQKSGDTITFCKQEW